MVTIDLTTFETGEEYPGNLSEALTALRERIALAQQVQMMTGRRAIIVLEGPEGGTKVFTLRQLAASLDPRFAMTCTVHPDRRRSQDGHWLARFWRDLPPDGHTALYFHSWYRRVLEDCVLGISSQAEVERAFDEINEFEAQQRDNGTLIVKLYFHVTPANRARRIAMREQESASHLSAVLDELRTDDARRAYDASVAAMLEQTHTRWSPWNVLDANDDGSSMVAALTAIASAMEKSFPAQVPDHGEAVVPFRRRGLVQPA